MPLVPQETGGLPLFTSSWLMPRWVSWIGWEVSTWSMITVKILKGSKVRYHPNVLNSSFEVVNDEDINVTWDSNDSAAWSFPYICPIHSRKIILFLLVCIFVFSFTGVISTSAKLKVQTDFICNKFVINSFWSHFYIFYFYIHIYNGTTALGHLKMIR